MTDTRQGTLRDYVRVLRKSRAAIVAATLLCAAFGAWLSLSQEPQYIAAATVSFAEGSRSSAEAGLIAVQPLTAAQIAAEGAATLLNNDVLLRTKRELQSRRTTAELRAMLTTSVDASSALVAVQATASDPRFAAALANEVARSAVAIQMSTERARLERTAEQIERQYENLRDERESEDRSELALANLLERISTLRTLSLTATPVRLAESASVPAAPTSPKPIRTTVFGGLIGLVLGIGLAFVRDSLDRRLRNSSEIEETLDLPVVGSVRMEALGSAAYVSNGRGPMTDQDVESFRVLRTNIEFLDVDRPIKSILVTSPQPEEGKSTVAASLAAANAAAGKRTLLVECDLRRPCLSDRLTVDRSPGLSDYLAGRAGPADIVQVVALSEAGIPANGRNGDAQAVAEAEAGRLAVIAAGSQSIRPAELLGSQRFRTFLEEITAAYDAVVIDTPPLLSVSDTLEIVPLADGVLLCIRADQTTREQARAVKGALAHLPKRTTAIVVTGLKPGREQDYGYYSHAYYGEP
jgi:Mrp family chromosome partitioning ATPase/capsular polysaccharide biosynthesis protein